jgi:hypothetical protein
MHGSLVEMTPQARPSISAWRHTCATSRCRTLFSATEQIASAYSCLRLVEHHRAAGLPQPLGHLPGRRIAPSSLGKWSLHGSQGGPNRERPRFCATTVIAACRHLRGAIDMSSEFVKAVQKSEIGLRPILPLAQPLDIGHVGTVDRDGRSR